MASLRPWTEVWRRLARALIEQWNSYNEAYLGALEWERAQPVTNF